MLYGLFVPIRVAHLCYSELRFGAQPLGRAALSSGRPLENSGLLGRLKPELRAGLLGVQPSGGSLEGSCGTSRLLGRLKPELRAGLVGVQPSGALRRDLAGLLGCLAD